MFTSQTRIDFRFLDFRFYFVLSLILERRAEDKPDLSPHRGLCVAPPRVQDPSLDSPLDGFPLSLGTEWRVYRIRFLRPVRIQHLSLPRTVPVTPGGRYIYHSHSHITLLGQLYSTIQPFGPLCDISRHSLPGTQEREVVVCSRRRGYTAVLGFSLSRHRSKLVPES